MTVSHKHSVMKISKRRGSLVHLIWLFPLVILIILTATGSRISEQQIRRELLQAWGVKESQIEKLSSLIGDLDPSTARLNSLLPDPPHQHPIPPRFSVQGTGYSFIFPHFGDGEIGGGRRFQTSWVFPTSPNQRSRQRDFSKSTITMETCRRSR